jgi:polyhydroxyalkanoate synthase
MNKTVEPPSSEDVERLAAEITDIAERSQRLVADFVEKTTESGSSPEDAQGAMQDAFSMGQAFMEFAGQMAANPAKFMEAQTALWTQYANLWQSTMSKIAGQDAAPVAAPEAGDRRFKDQEWSDNVVFDYIKQSYLLTSGWLKEQAHDAEGLDDHTAHRIDFYTRQFVDAMSPTNFVATNPQVLRETIESKGENLLHGLSNMLNDLEKGHGSLRISQTDMDAFEVGGNIAVTEGKVVYQNELMQLLHYAPLTETQFDKPLLIVPPWINKFYILDLKPENSFIRWATEQGHSVYVISWVNPTGDLRDKDFSNYMLEGPLAAVEAIKADVGAEKVNAVGYCLGGTLLSSTLAYAAKHGIDNFASATFFTTLVDFERGGELTVFVDEEQIQGIERKMAKDGYMDGADMAMTFNSLRSNDLIWSFVVSNYLLGKDPFPFDLLYWNSDSTRLPEAMHSFYLRSMYQENKLKEPGGVEMNGTPIDLRDIKTPSYFVAAKEDHIAPADAVYQGTKLFGGPVKYVLAASGHIAGVVNPPPPEKYGYWTNTKKPESLEEWFETSTKTKGSWWPDWQKWIARKAGKKAPARIPGENGLKAIEAAPGSYVQVRS